MPWPFVYRCLLAALLFIAHIQPNPSYSNENLWFSNQMTPEEVNRYGYFVAKDFALAVSQVLTLSQDEDFFEEALDVWQKSSMALLTSVRLLRETQQRSRLSQMAVDGVLDLIHEMVLGVFVDTDLIHSLSGCAWHCLDESSALEFENRFSDYFTQLLLQLNPSTNPPIQVV